MRLTLLVAACLLAVVVTVEAQSPGQARLAEGEDALQHGDYAKAIGATTEAAKLFEASNDRKNLRQALNTVGAAHLHQGEYDKALALFHRTEKLDRELGDIPGQLMRLNNIGGAYSFLGRYGEAYTSYRLAQERLHGQSAQPWYGRYLQLTLGNLAVLYQNLGQDQRALDVYKELQKLPLALQPKLEAQVLTNLAVVYRRLGDPRKALATYQQARELLAKDPNAAAQLYALHNTGVVRARDLEEFPEAITIFRQALAIAETTGSKREAVLERLFLGETLLRMHKPEEAARELEAALAAAQSMHLLDETWTALYGLARVEIAGGRTDAAIGKLQEAIGRIESSRSSLTNSLKEEFLADKRDVYDALIGLLLDQPKPQVGEIFRRMEEGRSRSLKDVLGKAKVGTSLAEVQRHLDGETTLVEYWITRDRWAAVWVTRDGAGVVPLEQSKEGVAKIEALLRALANRSAGDWRQLADAASTLLVRPVPALEGAMGRKVVIVADGVLHALPFEVLTSKNGKLLLEEHTISYLPTAYFQGEPSDATRPAGRRWPWQTEVTAFADPAPTVASANSPFGESWPRLPFSAEEAQLVARALPGRSRLFLGAENVKQSFLGNAGEDSAVLHLATHAAIDLQDSRRSRLIFTLMAGEENSQFLFRDEIARLALRQVELVTLAACESEKGRFVRGEGVEGFSRAFLGAGAASTVSTLWRVSDQSTSQLMQLFYAQLAAGKPKAEALRLAKLRFLGNGGELAHPYFWAAFVLNGDGASPLRPVYSWWMLGAGVLGVASLVLLAWQRFGRKH